MTTRFISHVIIFLPGDPSEDFHWKLVDDEGTTVANVKAWWGETSEPLTLVAPIMKKLLEELRRRHVEDFGY